MDQVPSAADARGPTPSRCAQVSHLLLAIDACEIAGHEVDTLAQHIEACTACRSMLDAVAPERPLPPLAERLGSTMTCLTGKLPPDGALVALLLKKRGGDEMTAQDEGGATGCDVVVLSEARVSLRVPQPPPAPDRFDGQFQPGQVLCGAAGTYVIKRLQKSDDLSETYHATVQAFVAGSQVQERGRVILKIPRVAADMSDQAAASRLQLLAGLLQAVIMKQRRLVACEHVAQLIDHGEYDHRLCTQTSRSVFVIYRYVDGLDLAQHMVAQHGGRFTGLVHAREFFEWARKLTMAVHETHQCVVIHGDICPHNIIVDRVSGRPVFVDLGQSLFVEAMNRVERLRGSAYRAADLEQTPSSDLFSLGGVLYFLATGSDPHGLGHCTDAELLKQQVEDHIRAVNANLFEEEGGIVDIIARCLRKDGRVQHAAQLLQDIETFDPTPVPRRLVDTVSELRRLADELDGAGNALFHWVAGLRMRSLLEMLRDMNRGVLDFSGDSKDICTAACALIRALGEGDEFLALSLPQFWWPGNMGINGRFLTTNRMAAARGVRIERILLLDSGLEDDHLDLVVAAQRKVAADLRYSKNYSVKYIRMSLDERRQFVCEGNHFALFVRQGHCIAMFPVYSGAGKLVTLRFRTDEALVRGLRGVFDRCLESARPLADLDIPVRTRSSGEPKASARSSIAERGPCGDSGVRQLQR